MHQGLPITYNVPDHQGAVVSGLIMGDSVLVRRTDFGDDHRPVEVIAGTKVITDEYAPGVCKVMDISK